MARDEKNRFIVIMAGGSGTRLWPLSRKSKPKQFHTFLSNRTLFEETLERAKGVVPEDHIFVSTGKQHINTIYDILPDFPKNRLIIEPFPRGTAPAIALVSATISARHPGAIVATLASDHAIENEDAFASAIVAAFETVAEAPNKLVTIGINPTSPDTGLGYIRMGKRYQNPISADIFFVDEFKEKPDRATAETYLSDWRYLWNAGYFIFSAGAMLGWIRKYAPDLAKATNSISTLAKKDALTDEALADIYADAENEAIEPLIVEKLSAATRLVVPAPIRWSDIGSWNSLYEFFKVRHGKESVLSGDCIEYDGKGNLIYGTKKRTITTFGVKDLVIVDTDDALLVAQRDQAPEMKKLVEELKRRGFEHLL